jgi:hypothetical protein
MMEYIIQPAVKEFGLKVIRADQMSKPGMIGKQVIEHILRSRLVIADLSFHNPNVFYELCLRQRVVCQFSGEFLLRRFSGGLRRSTLLTGYEERVEDQNRDEAASREPEHALLPRGPFHHVGGSAGFKHFRLPRQWLSDSATTHMPVMTDLSLLA